MHLLPKDERGKGEWGKDEWLSMGGGVCVGPRSRGRTERKTEGPTTQCEQHPLIFSVLNPPPCLASCIQRHSHLIPLEDKPPCSWDPGQREEHEAEHARYRKEV